MYVTNRDLGVMVAAAVVMAACAVLMMVSAVPDRVSRGPVETSARAVVPDVTREGGAVIDPYGPLVVHAIGKPPESVLLTCDMFKAQRAFEGNTAWFTSLPIGDCALALGDARPYQPVYPGDELRCAIDRGRTACMGGLATSRAARVDVESGIPATLTIDDQALGPLPARDLALRVGRRELRLDYADGHYARYVLAVEPDQRIRVVFPIPAGVDPAVLPTPPVAEPLPAAPPTEGAAGVASSANDDDTGSHTDP